MKNMQDYINYYNKGINYLNKKIMFRNINNATLQDYAYREWCYKKLYNKYKNVLNTSYEESNEKENEDIVWICWLQGIENAPELVKRCYESVKRHLKNRKIVVITQDNYEKYAKLPQYIIDKWKKGIISHTHFSDLLRVALLSEHGGLWLDATVYITEDIKNDYDVSLFVFQNVMLNKKAELSVVASSWLIYSHKRNPIILTTRDLLYKYWEKENKLKNYNIFHFFFTMATRKYSDIWKKVPVYNNIAPHILQFELLDTYTEQRWNQIKQMSPIHKLNYRIEENLKHDTFYNFIMNDERIDY